MKKHHLLIALPLLALLLLLRVWKLPGAGLYDYDAVRNLEIIRNLLGGDFKELFHHASPTHFVLSAPLLLLSDHYLTLEFFNAALNIGGLLLFIFWLRKKLSWTAVETLAAAAFAGSCLFWLYEARCIAAENMSLPFFVIFLILYEKSFSDTKKARFYFLLSVFVFALTFTVNYKVLTFLPAVLLAEVWKGGSKGRKIGLKGWLFGGLIFLGVLLFWSLIGAALGLEAWRYGAYLFTILTRGGNPEGLYFLQSDFLFHLKYLLYFESPLLFPGLLLCIFFLWKKRKQTPFTLKLLALLTLSFTAYMQLTFKVPRALSFAYLPLYFLAFEGFRYLFDSLKVSLRGKEGLWLRLFLPLLILLSLGLQSYRAQTELYAYADTNYDEMAEEMRERRIGWVVTTVGNGIQPFLIPEQEFHVLMRPEQLESMQQNGLPYLLYDSYTDLIDRDFPVPEGSRRIAAYREPSMLSLFLYLEQNDMSGLGFEGALELREKMKAREAHLILYELRENQ